MPVQCGIAPSHLIETAMRYLHAGLCVLPAVRSEKRPAVPRWKQFQNVLPPAEQLAAWFQRADALCLVCGAVSGNLEMLDFDLGGEAFDAWRSKIDANLLSRLVVERSPSGGYHVVYRCQEAVCGNLKLAQKIEYFDGPEEVIIGGKTYKPRQDAQGRRHVVLTTIETRGEGGLFLCSPTPGYELVQGDLAELPTLTADERETLLEAAWSLNEYWPQPTGASGGLADADGRPGDDFNRRGDVRALLRRHGWTLVKPAGSDGNEHWRRPGKPSGVSATLKEGVFYCFSSNAAPLEPNRAYSPFSLYAILEHGGDYTAAAADLRAQGFGDERDRQPAVDLSGMISVNEPTPPAEPATPDPGLMPDEMLRIPGFVSEVMDYCLATAPYPNQALAFGGALALQAFLGGRRVRDSGDNRTNIYILGLAHSSVGKDWIRKLNASILHQTGLAACLGDRIASGEGVQDALNIHPAMLFQTDEIDGLLQAINKSTDARYENIMNTLLTLYSASNSIFPMRPKAGRPDPGVIDQPCLVLFGTAIPNHYYEALSERMLTNGFFARMIILEASRRGNGQEPGMLEIPPRVLETAKWWADFRPGYGNLDYWHPVPAIVESTDEARALLVEHRRMAEAEYTKAEISSDAVGTTVWGRVSEQVRKLALIYAISENHQQPCIHGAAVRWASEFVTHQAKRMLFMASQYVADNPFHALCLKAIKKLRESPNQTAMHSVLLKRMKIDTRLFNEVINTLYQRQDIEIVLHPTAGRIHRAYRLVSQNGHVDNTQNNG